jgi:peroxiredoxin
MRFFRMAALLMSAVLLQAAEAPPIQRHSPEFVIHFPDGSQSLLSSYRGKVVGLLFVYTTCIHCQHTSQLFSKLNTEFGARGFQPIDVAFNDMSNLFVKDFVKDNGVNYPVGFSAREPVLDFLKIPVIERFVVPQIVWIDRKGNIRSQTNAMGTDEKQMKESYWREMIETLLKEPAESAKKTPVHRTTSAKKT